MKYYVIDSGKIELTKEGIKALEILGISLEELKDYSNDKLEKSYWQPCKSYLDQSLREFEKNDVKSGGVFVGGTEIPIKDEKDIPKGGYGRMKIGMGKPMEHQEYDRNKPSTRIPRAEGDRIEYGLNGDEPSKKTDKVYGKYKRVPYSTRIPYESEKEHQKLRDNRKAIRTKREGPVAKGYGMKPQGLINSQQSCQGRFPANILCQDNALGKDSKYFDIGKWHEQYVENIGWKVAKPSKREKNLGCENMEKEIGHNRFDTCEKCGGYILQNPDRPSACKCTKPARKHNKIKGNYHPTVKPILLFKYLLTMFSRENDIVLDPFCGSGTTLCCSIEMGRRYIGIDSDEDSVKIAKARVEYWQENFRAVQEVML